MVGGEGGGVCVKGVHMCVEQEMVRVGSMCTC